MFFETSRDKSAYFLKADNICGTHFHRSAEILYNLQGEKTVWLNGTKYILHSGEILFCVPYAVHTFLPNNNSVQIVAVVPPDFCKRFENFCETREPSNPVYKDEDGVILKLISELEEEQNEILYEGIVNCILGIFIQNTPFLPAKPAPDRSEIQSIADYIDTNFATSLSLATLAEKFGYSPNYFSALFKKYFMTGVTNYINSVRVQKSVSMLKKHKISAVYFLCGFNSPQQYFLNFRKFFGCSPYEYLHSEKTAE